MVWFSASSLSAGNSSAAAQQGTLCWPLFTSLPDPEDVTGAKKDWPYDVVTSDILPRAPLGIRNHHVFLELDIGFSKKSLVH